MAKKSKLHKKILSSLAGLFCVFDGDYATREELDLMATIDPNDPKSVTENIYALLVPSFKECSSSSQKSYLDKLEFLLKDETEDFSELFNFHLQGGVFFGEDLVETRQFVEIAYDILKKECKKGHHQK